VSLVQVAAAAATVGPVASSGRVRVWSPQFFNGTETYTTDQATAIARNFDAIVALPTVFKGMVGQMKAANPSLTTFVYMKEVFTYDTTLPEADYAHDALGQRIQGVQFAGTWLLDPSNPAVYSYDLGLAQQKLQQSGYDGIFLDTMGTAPLGAGYVTGIPVNPATGQVWTAPAWLNANAALAGKLATGLGKPVIGNGLRDGTSYFDPTAPSSILIGTGMVGAMAEQWMRDATSSITAYPSETDWLNDVNAVVDAGARNESFLAVTKTWATATQAQKDAWYTFTVASFLMGTDGKAYLSFTGTQGDSTVPNKYDNLDLGAPQGPFAKVANVYQRSFAGGRVLVNVSPKTSYTVSLGGAYHTIDGVATGATLTMAPDSAVILTNG
jgi:hypothetical protein